MVYKHPEVQAKVKLIYNRYLALGMEGTIDAGVDTKPLQPCPPQALEAGLLGISLTR
jgi:hypothetical protein